MVDALSVKVYLGIPETDTLQDGLLTQIIIDMQTKVQNYIKETVIPPSLEWIVRELAIARFNRIGSEGMTSIGEEGKSESYLDDVFLTYVQYLDTYLANSGSVAGRGKARFM